MCIQSYERYILCPCQLKRGTFNKCADPNCHSVTKPVYRTNAPYCFYHARATCAASTSRKLFFARKGVTSSSPSPLNIPATALILGGIISGVPLSTAFAGSGIDFMDGKRVVVDDSSDDPDRGKFAANRERRDFGREENRVEFAGRKEDLWAKVGTPRREYWEPSARARRGSRGRPGPLKAGREKSRTWVEWRKFRRAREEVKAKEKSNRRSETESTSAKEESQLLSTTELEEFEAMALSDAMTLELSMSYLVSSDSKTRDDSPPA
ncbi:uncharacterized protein F4807DRAFT_427817 [Annulohypoxylon truncatum]|uniref:uncharacterized protein n=1 Tax=Annulohypoxylon truncatum TaxID=327061 RepID=UPI0020073F98|nr:uncharacterized protein F4807DRAFT_427817 [Annulohypoxylon truncatum]KAI1209275.1 hypothetical protein F4807DRAFT_427817 [Annulohypoxylon truncatum]